MGLAILPNSFPKYLFSMDNAAMDANRKNVVKMSAILPALFVAMVIYKK